MSQEVDVLSSKPYPFGPLARAKKKKKTSVNYLPGLWEKQGVNVPQGFSQVL